VSDNSNESDHALVIPAFGKVPALRLGMNKIKEAESRYTEVQLVNPSTYVELEHVFNESYRDLKQYVSSVGYNLGLAKKAAEEAKADVILGSYQEYLKDKPKYHNNTDLREAFLAKDPAYSEALEKVEQLKALESHLEGKIKVVENVCRFMRKKMDLILRSGLSDSALYSTQGKKYE